MKAAMMIIIENCQNQMIKGSLQSFYQREPVSFSGLDHMLFQMEELLDRECGTATDVSRLLHPLKPYTESAWPGSGNHAFVVHIYSRQNGSIQGEIRSCRGGVCFKSGLELIRMIRDGVKEPDHAKEMERALEEEQFAVWFQPQLDLVWNRGFGAEALVRWNHPKSGLLMPGEFIPEFERNGLISKLDCYVAERVCRLMGRWYGEGCGLNPIAVNLSRLTLSDPEVPEMLLGLTKRYHVPASLLNLEITESACGLEQKQVRTAIRDLRRAGFSVLMDDFGSGFSSLNMLKETDVDALKIDMNFLSRGIATEKEKIILTSIIQMAARLGLPVIAEGVETKKQCDFLRTAGCSCIQGYFYARPMPLDEYERTYIYGIKE